MHQGQAGGVRGGRLRHRAEGGLVLRHTAAGGRVQANLQGRQQPNHIPPDAQLKGKHTFTLPHEMQQKNIKMIPACRPSSRSLTTAWALWPTTTPAADTSGRRSRSCPGTTWRSDTAGNSATPSRRTDARRTTRGTGARP